MFKLTFANCLTGSVVLLGLIAVFWDLKCRKIPNGLTLMATLYGLVIWLVWDTSHWFMPIFGVLAGFIMFFPFFALGGLGAGDVKLIMAIGAIWGPRQLIWVILLSAVSGGVISLFKMMMEYGVKEACTRIYLLITAIWDTNRRRLMLQSRGSEHLYIPYGVAILAGIILTLVLRP